MKTPEDCYSNCYDVMSCTVVDSSGTCCLSSDQYTAWRWRQEVPQNFEICPPEYMASHQRRLSYYMYCHQNLECNMHHSFTPKRQITNIQTSDFVSTRTKSIAACLHLITESVEIRTGFLSYGSLKYMNIHTREDNIQNKMLQILL